MDAKRFDLDSSGVATPCEDGSFVLYRRYVSEISALAEENAQLRARVAAMEKVVEAAEHVLTRPWTHIQDAKLLKQALAELNPGEGEGK